MKKKKQKNLNHRMPYSLWAELTDIAEKKGKLSFTQFINEILIDYVDSQNK